MKTDIRSNRAGRNIVITYPYPLGRANGAARHVRELSRHLGRLGANVVVIAVSATPQTRSPRPEVEAEFLGFEFDEELKRDSVQVIRVPQDPRHWQRDGKEVLRAIRHLVANQSVDAVLGFYHEAAYLPAYLKANGIAFGYIAAWQSYEMALAIPKRARLINRFRIKRRNRKLVVQPYRKAQILFANSRFTRSELVDVIGVSQDRIVVCPLGVDQGFLDVPRREPEAITRFIFFGRLIHSKGVFDAIRALAKVAASGNRNWEFRLLGQQNHKWVRKAALKNGIPDNVYVGGPLNDGELQKELEQAHLAILPSHAESFGLSIAEAQAAGLPVIAYDATAVPEVVENGVTGWLVALQDADELYQAILEAVANPQITYLRGLAGRDRVAEKFCWENSARIVLDGLNHLTQQQPSGVN